MKRTYLFLIITALVMAVGFAGCQKKEPEPQPVVTEEEPEYLEEKVAGKGETTAAAEAAASVEGAEEEAPAFYEGIVTFLSGEAEIRHEPELTWAFLDVDDSVFGNDRVKTGIQSFCEVQFTEFGIIRIQQQTEVILKSVLLKEEENKVRLKLDKGNLLCKIDKLKKDEEFQVETSTVLAGVRGTEFMVRETEGGETVVAVNEGEVQVVPNEIAQRIDMIKADLQSQTAKDVLEEITVSEIVVSEQQEVLISPREVDAAVKQFEGVSPIIEEKIRKIDEKAFALEQKEQIIEQQPGERTAENLREVQEMKEEIQVLREDMALSTREVNKEIKEIIEKIDPVSRTSQEEFDDIRKMQRRDFVIAAKRGEKETEEDKPDEPLYAKLTIEVKPADAQIIVDGRESGRGTFRGLYESGTRLHVRVVRKGYTTAERTISVARQQRQRVYIELESPIVWEYRKEGEHFVRKAAVLKNRIVLAGSSGALLCLGEKGDRVWSVATENRPNDNSMPVLMNGKILFSGNAEFVVVDVVTGEVVGRMPLQKEQYPSHIFGSPAVPFGRSILFPATDRLLLLDADDFRQTRSIPVEGPGLGSPAPYKDRLVTVNERGELLVMNAEKGSIEYSLATGAFQMVGSAPSISGDVAVFGDNMGMVVLADLSKQEVKWEKRIGTSQSAAVFQDIAVGDVGVYPFTGDDFFALSIQNGEELFRSVRSTCNPLYREGMLYFGDSGSSLVMMEATTGRVLKRYGLDSPITLTPAFYENMVLVATRSGTVYLLDIGSI